MSRDVIHDPLYLTRCALWGRLHECIALDRQDEAGSIAASLDLLYSRAIDGNARINQTLREELRTAQARLQELELIHEPPAVQH